MTFGSGAGLVLLTTAIGGCAGAGLAAFLIKYLQISNFEGGSGYFAVLVSFWNWNLLPKKPLLELPAFVNVVLTFVTLGT